MCLLTASVFFFKSAFRSHANQLCTSQYTAGWLGFKELPTSSCQVEPSLLKGESHCSFIPFFLFLSTSHCHFNLCRQSLLSQQITLLFLCFAPSHRHNEQKTLKLLWFPHPAPLFSSLSSLLLFLSSLSNSNKRYSQFDSNK